MQAHGAIDPLHYRVLSPGKSKMLHAAVAGRISLRMRFIGRISLCLECRKLEPHEDLCDDPRVATGAWQLASSTNEFPPSSHAHLQEQTQAVPNAGWMGRNTTNIGARQFICSAMNVKAIQCTGRATMNDKDADSQSRLCVLPAQTSMSTWVKGSLAKNFEGQSGGIRSGFTVSIGRCRRSDSTQCPQQSM